jgi:hypothetical protein
MSQATLVIQDTERAVRRDMPPIAGLCRTCSRADTCTFPRDPSRPVWSCDEFEGGEDTPSRSVTPAFSSVVQRKAEEVMGLKGLCRQCAHRFTCVYPKPLGGVWHCDELA